MDSRIKIAFIGDVSSSFIKHDYEILKEFFDVNVFQPPRKKISWIRYVFSLAKTIKKNDLIFSWFAGWHSAFAVFFSRIYKKRSIVVVGGFDAANVPEFKYGAFSNIKEKIPARYVLKRVDKILVVEPSLKDDIIKNAKVKGDNIEYIPTGYNPEVWKQDKSKQNIVLTVAGASDLIRVKLKGLDTFVKAAKSLPETKFVLIGIKDYAKEYLKQIAPKNVELIEFIPREKLLSYYQTAKVYCQLSYREGLSSTLCEAMLCECIPVGTKANGIKTVIGDTGFYADFGDEKTTFDMIKKALECKDDLGKKARERVKKLFSDTKRKEGLRKVVLGMMK